MKRYTEAETVKMWESPCIIAVFSNTNALQIHSGLERSRAEPLSVQVWYFPAFIVSDFSEY